MLCHSVAVMTYAVIAKSIVGIIQLHGTAYCMKARTTIVTLMVSWYCKLQCNHASQHLLPKGFDGEDVFAIAMSDEKKVKKMTRGMHSSTLYHNRLLSGNIIYYDNECNVNVIYYEMTVS